MALKSQRHKHFSRGFAMKFRHADKERSCKPVSSIPSACCQLNDGHAVLGPPAWFLQILYNMLYMRTQILFHKQVHAYMYKQQRCRGTCRLLHSYIQVTYPMQSHKSTSPGLQPTRTAHVVGCFPFNNKKQNDLPKRMFPLAEHVSE